MQNDIAKAAQNFKQQTKKLSKEQALEHFYSQQKRYEAEYSDFFEHYKKESCYLCKKSFNSISKSDPCLHWLLRRCKFKKKDFTMIAEKFDFYSISAYLRWVANIEGGIKSINNLKEESSDRKIFEATIKWKNIEWTLDCSKNDLLGHKETKTDFPHWHFQMRIDGQQFINFNDFHIKFSMNDLLKIELSNDASSGFYHTFGPAGDGMQEHMDQLMENPDKYLEEAMYTADQNEGSVHLQSHVTAPESGISGEQINQVLEMSQLTGKTLAFCIRKVLEHETGVSIVTIASPSDGVPEIAKRTPRDRR